MFWSRTFMMYRKHLHNHHTHICWPKYDSVRVRFEFVCHRVSFGHYNAYDADVLFKFLVVRIALVFSGVSSLVFFSFLVTLLCVLVVFFSSVCLSKWDTSETRSKSGNIKHFRTRINGNGKRQRWLYERREYIRYAHGRYTILFSYYIITYDIRWIYWHFGIRFIRYKAHSVLWFSSTKTTTTTTTTTTALLLLLWINEHCALYRRSFKCETKNTVLIWIAWFEMFVKRFESAQRTEYRVRGDSRGKRSFFCFLL